MQRCGNQEVWIPGSHPGGSLSHKQHSITEFKDKLNYLGDESGFHGMEIQMLMSLFPEPQNVTGCGASKEASFRFCIAVTDT